MTGVDILHLPYRGEARALSHLMDRQVQVLGLWYGPPRVQTASLIRADEVIE